MTTDIRTEILSGYLSFPKFDTFVEKYGPDIMSVADDMWCAVWRNYMHKGDKGTISLPLWATKFNNPTVFNRVLKSLSLQGWLVTSADPKTNFATAIINVNKLLDHVSVDELAHVRAEYKISHYLPKFRNSKATDLVKINGKTCKTGLVREGFAKASNTQYYYDVEYLIKYQEAINLNVTKGMAKVREIWTELGSDEASFDKLSVAIVQDLIDNPIIVNQGGNKSDSRGRAIKNSLSWVFNPIGYKDARALITIPLGLRNLATEEGAIAIYLFIAELAGVKSSTVQSKIEAGRNCYTTRYTHDLDLTDEEDRRHLYENIWLERLYDDLDGYYSNDTYYWSVPVELDASASMLQYIGVLLNDRRLCEMTNLIGEELSDPWSDDVLSRNHVKKAFTPLLYGSSRSATQLWDKNKLAWTLEQMVRADTLLQTGAFAVANKFKDFVIGHVKPKEHMNVTIGSDNFNIQCNRYHHVGDKTTCYSIYDTTTDRIRTIENTSRREVADLKAFKRYFQTLLVHNLDSQVANAVAGAVYDNYEWCIDIHDAFIVSPEAVLFTRNEYADQLEQLHTNRKEILGGYFASIGIGAESQKAWNDLQAMIEPMDTFQCGLMALK